MNLALRFVVCAPLLFALGCASTPEAIVGDAYDEILVLPMNVAVNLHGTLEGRTGPVTDIWNEYLEAQGRNVRHLGQVEAGRAWRKALAQVEALEVEPEVPFEEAGRLMALGLAQSEPFDVLLVPALVMRNAPTKGYRAQWDGAAQRIEFAEAEGLSGPSEFKRSAGIRDASIAAVSLHVWGLDRNGVEVYDRLAGVDLVDRIRLEQIGSRVARRMSIDEKRYRTTHVNPGDSKVKIVFEQRDEFLSDRDVLYDGVARSLHPFFPMRGDEDR